MNAQEDKGHLSLVTYFTGGIISIHMESHGLVSAQLYSDVILKGV